MDDLTNPGIIGDPSNPYQQEYSDTCAIKSQQLILNEFGVPVTEDQLVQYSMEHGWYTGDGSGTQMGDIGKLLTDAGIPCTQTQNANVYDLVDALQQGHKVIVGVDSSELWDDNPITSWLKDTFQGDTPDHALIVAGIDNSDPNNPMVILTDPGTGQAVEPYPLDQFMDAWSDSQHFMVSTDVPTPEAVNTFMDNDNTSFHLNDIAGVDYNTFNDYLNYSHTLNYMDQFNDLFNTYKIFPTMDNWSFDDALSYAHLPAYDPTQFITPDAFDPSTFNYDSLNNTDWLNGDDYSGTGDMTIHSLNVLSDSYDDCIRHAQECMDDGMPISSQMWMNEAHDAQSTMDDIINNC